MPDVYPHQSEPQWVFRSPVEGPVEVRGKKKGSWRWSFVWDEKLKHVHCNVLMLMFGLKTHMKKYVSIFRWYFYGHSVWDELKKLNLDKNSSNNKHSDNNNINNEFQLIHLTLGKFLRYQQICYHRLPLGGAKQVVPPELNPWRFARKAGVLTATIWDQLSGS